MLEINVEGWFGWKNNQSSKFENSVPHALLCQVSGLRAYIGAASAHEANTPAMDSKGSDVSTPSGEFVNREGNDQFYDAICTDSSSSTSSDDSDNEVELNIKGNKVNLKTDPWAIAKSSLKRTSAPDANREFCTSADPIAPDPHDFQGSMRLGTNEADRDCWTSPGGSRFMIRGKTYLKYNAKIAVGDPLLKLIAVD